MTLVVLAAGMGSRYGGLKQMDPMNADGDFIIDYSVYDAVQAGFDEVVFIIKRAMEQDFMATIGARVSKKIKVTLVYQDMDDLPEGIRCRRDASSRGAPRTLCARHGTSSRVPMA